MLSTPGWLLASAVLAGQRRRARRHEFDPITDHERVTAALRAATGGRP